MKHFGAVSAAGDIRHMSMAQLVHSIMAALHDKYRPDKPHTAAPRNSRQGQHIRQHAALAIIHGASDTLANNVPNTDLLPLNKRDDPPIPAPRVPHDEAQASRHHLLNSILSDCA
jgi:hypothetical protein